MNNNCRWQDYFEGTDEQLEAMKSDKALTVVSAGAGTGKTNTLSQRFAWLVANDKNCSADEILVLTFTKKAAEEMRSRIKSNLEKLNSKYGSELSHLGKAISVIDEAYISTIDSFAMRLIRESGLNLDIDPVSTIIPTPMEVIWWENAGELLTFFDFEKLFEHLPEEWRDNRNSILKDSSEINNLKEVINSFDSKQLIRALKTAIEKLSSCGKTPEELWQHDNSEVYNEIARESKEYKKSLYLQWKKDILQGLDVELSKKNKLSGGENKLKDLCEKYAEADESAENFYDIFVNDILEITKGIRGNIVNNYLSDVLCNGGKVSEWRNETIKKLMSLRTPSNNEIQHNKTLCRFTALLWVAWNEYRRREKVLSFSDLVCYSSRIIESSPEYRKKFKHIMIDEFQDTNRLQNDFIKKLWNAPKHGDKTLPQNTLFLVGDMKQSIYRFRHADLTLFNEYIKRCNDDTEHSKYISLSKNFRTSASLLEKFDCVFSGIWSKNDDLVYEKLVSGGEKTDLFKDNETDFEEVIVECPCNDNEKGKIEKKDKKSGLKQLYYELGNRFKSIKNSGKLIKDGNLERELTWKDFAILARSHAEFNEAENIFDSLGIPYVIYGSRGYYGRSEVQDIINLLRLLNEPRNPLYLLGYLSSPFSDISKSEVASLVNYALEEKHKKEKEELMAKYDAEGEKTEYKGHCKLPLYEILNIKKRIVVERIEEYRRIAMMSGTAAVVCEIMKQPKYLEKISPVRRLRVDANIKNMVMLLEEYEKSYGKSLKGASDYMALMSKDIQSTEDPEFFDEETDAVHMMSIHASKGLEFPITAVIFSRKRKQSDQSPIIVSPEYGIIAKKTVDETESDKKINTVLAERQKKVDEKAEFEETKRLWYVALTRAEYKLFFCLTDCEQVQAIDNSDLGLIDKFKAESFCNELISGKNSSCPYDKLIKHNDGFLIESQRDKNNEHKAADKFDGVDAFVKNPARIARLTASAYALISWCPKAYRAIYRQGRNAEYLVKEGEEHGAEFGSMLHRILCVWDFTQENLNKLLPDENSGEIFIKTLNRMPDELKECYDSAKERKKAREMLADYMKNKSEQIEKFRSLVKNHSLMRETSFRVPTEYGTVLVGATDMFWSDKEGLHLRDWKSSSEKYAPSYYYMCQLDFYAYALNQSLKNRELKIDSSIIYLKDTTSSDKKIRIYDADKFSEIGRQIKNAAEMALKENKDNFVENSERCPTCPWKTLCKK